MKNIFSSLFILAAGGIGLAVGFGLRGKVVSRISASSAATSKMVTQGVSPFRPGPAAAVKDDSPLVTKLEQDLFMSSGVTHWLYWIDAIERAALPDFPRLARLARERPAALRFIAARWVQLAPRHLFDTLVAISKTGDRAFPLNELVRPLFDQWPRRDPDAAIAALNEPDDFGMRNYWRDEIASTILDQDVERGLRLMAEWHIEHFGPRMKAVVEWAAANPGHAAEFTLQNSVGYVAQLAMEATGREWAKTDPSSALAFAAARTEGLARSLGTEAMKVWAERNLNDAADWLAKAAPRTRNNFSPALVEVWAKQDATGALTWCEENLNGSVVAQAMGGVLKGAAAKNVETAAALVLEMAPSAARAEAAAAVARQWFPEFASLNPVKPEAVFWLAGLDRDSVKRALADIKWNWAGSDPKSMAAFLAASSGLQLSESYFSLVAQQMAQQHPDEAIEWASRLPEESGLKAGAEAFAVWRDSQPEAAMKWWNALPSGDARRQPFFEMGIRTLAYHPQATEQLAAMTTAERAAARGVIVNMKSLPEERRACLLAALAE